MTEIEKLETRIAAINTAVVAVKSAMGIDRKLSHAKHNNDHFTNALDQLDIVLTGLKSLKIRVETLGV